MPDSTLPTAESKTLTAGPDGAARPRPTGRGVLIGLLAGLVFGAVATALAGWAIVPNMMMTKVRSRLPFDQTVAALEQAVTEQGWALKGTSDLNEELAARGREISHRVKVVRLCKADYAQAVLEGDPYVANLMPCTFAVYEQDGEVYVATTNKGLMGKMFGGKIAEIMGGAVVEDEDAMIEGIAAQ